MSYNINEQTKGYASFFKKGVRMFKDEFFQKILLSICFLILFNPAQSFACDDELGYC